MADIYSKEKRSQIMSSVKSKNSEAELIVFKYLTAHKIYFKRHYSRVPGTPDIALPRKKIAIFLDGDFWHGRTLEIIKEKHGLDSYWYKKLSSNVERDLKQRKILKDNGWKILSVWESDIKRKRTRDETLLGIAKFLKA